MAPNGLIGFSEVADLLGVPRSTAARYTNRPGFPKPVERLASGRVWKRADVEKWKRANLPLRTGRPRKS